MIAKWRIYYGDGSTYDGPVADAPPVDVQCIVKTDVRGSPYEVGRLVCHSFDYYIYADDEWLGLNTLVDLVDHVLFRSVGKVLKGRMIPNHMFEAILDRANKDEDFPQKMGTHPLREDGT